jgi:hypothetical protein
VASGIFSTSRYFSGIIGSDLLTGLLDSTQSSGSFDAIFPMVVVAAFLSAVVGFGLRDWPTAEPNSTNWVLCTGMIAHSEAQPILGGACAYP